MSYYGNSLHAFALEDIPMINSSHDISEVIIQSLTAMNETLKENDIIIIASKIISKAENTLVDFRSFSPTDKAYEIAEKTNRHPGFVQYLLEYTDILGYNDRMVLARYKRNGLVSANGGVDRDNVVDEEAKNFGWLLPKDPNKSARILKEKLQSYYNNKIGVIIQDSNSRPWRLGTISLSIGSAGVKMLDTFSKERNFTLKGTPGLGTQVGLGDQIVNIGGVLMGERTDKTPIVVVRGLKNVLDDTQSTLSLNRKHSTPWEHNASKVED